MSTEDWRTAYPEIVRILEGRLGNKDSCLDLIDEFEQVLNSVRGFTAVLLGDGGTRAVLTRSVQLASQKAPLLQKVRISETAVDFSEFRNYLNEASCTMPAALEAVLWLGVTIFQTLSDLTGDSITDPLLGHLKSTTDEQDQK